MEVSGGVVRELSQVRAVELYREDLGVPGRVIHTRAQVAIEDYPLASGAKAADLSKALLLVTLVCPEPSAFITKMSEKRSRSLSKAIFSVRGPLGVEVEGGVLGKLRVPFRRGSW